MRFFANGPSIPDSLLEARDRGDVVFLCGAGVSQPAGLPSFVELARRIVDSLGAPDNAASRTMLGRAQQDPEFGPSVDQIFSALQREYGAARIEQEVSRHLATPTNANVEPHRVILRLSRSAIGTPQVVTTNFDLLFERTGQFKERHIPPALPDLASGQPINGIVYLHGRRTPKSSVRIGRQGFVVSSGDFGRAYLADGWATRFVRDLLQTYVIVLVGYSASDPPVRYLLEGLHSRQRDVYPSAIFAFAEGTDEEVHERWQYRGVRPLAYPKSDRAHSALWNTLGAWAIRADDRDAWQSSILALAKRGPRRLAPHQRGQVAALVRTETGAKVFAEAAPSPPAEWLCVFDESIRRAEPVGMPGANADPFDPRAVYGLDDDPRRQSSETATSNAIGDDILSQATGDEPAGSLKRLAGPHSRFGDPLPPRLFHLTRWIGRVLSSPVTAWWAAGYPTLHPTLLNEIALRLERPSRTLHKHARRAWFLLLEEFRHSPKEDHDFGWYGFQYRLKNEGWSNGTLREFQRTVQPYLRSTRPLGGGSIPPLGNWTKPHQAVSFEIRYPARHRPDLIVPTRHLPEVFRAVRQGLERASQLLRDIEMPYFRTATLHPENKPGDRMLDEADHYLAWVVDLFNRLVIEKPDIARRELMRWPPQDEYFFDKLRLYGLTK